MQEPSGPIVNVVEPVTSPRVLFDASNASAVKACEPPAVIDAEAGLIVMWSTAADETVRVALPVAPAAVPVTAWAPSADALQVAPTQAPSGSIVNVVFAVMSPSELPY